MKLQQQEDLRGYYLADTISLTDIPCTNDPDIIGLTHDLFTWNETEEISYKECKHCGMMVEFDDEGVEFQGYRVEDLGVLPSLQQSR